MFIRIIVVHLLKQKQIIMSKTKYIKVLVSKRVPDESKEYITDLGFLKYSSTMNFFIGHPGLVQKPKYWLEEVPDREDEMREMLSRIQDLDILPEEIEYEVGNLLNTLK